MASAVPLLLPRRYGFSRRGTVFDSASMLLSLAESKK